MEDLNVMSSYRIPENYTFKYFNVGESLCGIICGTAIDVIHGFLLGIMQYLNVTFTDQLTGKQVDKFSKMVVFTATFYMLVSTCLTREEMNVVVCSIS